MAMLYSEIRTKLKKQNKREFKQGAAALTHLLQSRNASSSSYFKQEAGLLISELRDPNFNYELPLEFDVPFPPIQSPEFTFIDLFAGIGGFRLAFQKQKGKCVFSSEWDKHAQQTYEANFGEIPFGDITKIDETNIPDHDILVGGFPCQPFSIAGVSKKNSLGRMHGFLDKTQGTLFFDIARIINAKRPKAFILENVKNLRSHDKGNTFKVIVETLEELGYSIFSQILDARHYVPQHRERIFIVGFDKHVFKDSFHFSFPTPPEQQPKFKDILEKNPPSKYTLSDHLWGYLQNYAKKHQAKGNGFGFGMTDLDGISRTLSARYYKDGSEVLVPRGKDLNPRRLTPEECKRLMGFPEKYIISNIGVSDTQLYRQFGNSVAVPVATAVARQIVDVMKHYLERSINPKHLALDK